MFNGLIDSTLLQPRSASLSRNSGGSTSRRRTDLDIAKEKMEQRLTENK
jgi:hypothetical protein